MASVQYLKNGVFRVVYRDHTATANTGKRVDVNFRAYLLDANGNRIKNDRGKAREIKARQAELMLDAQQKELETMNPDLPKAIWLGDTIAERLTKQAEIRPCRSTRPKSINAARYAIDLFIQWLAKQKKQYTFDDFTRGDALRYADSLGKGRTKKTILSYTAALASVWEILRDDDSKIRDNPWKGIGKKVQSEIKGQVARGAFSKDWMAGFWKSLDGHKQGLRVYFFLLMLTGWRKDSVFQIKAGDVQIASRVLRCQHGKTADRTGHTSYLYMTDLMIQMIAPLVAAKADDEPIFKGHASANGALYLFDAYLANHKPQDFMELDTGTHVLRSHSLQAFRRSVITHLKMAGFADELARYVSGHAPRTMEEKHYNKFSVDIEASTRGAVEYMERVILGVEQTREEKLAKLQAAGLTIEDLRALIQG